MAKTITRDRRIIRAWGLDGVTDTGLDLREFRLDQGWNQKRLSEELGVTQGLVAQIERGDAKMSAAIEGRLAALKAEH